jgi:hypothetical protein
VLARRRRGVGIEDSDLSGVTSASEFFLPKGTGTMAEGVSGIPTPTASRRQPPQGHDRPGAAPAGSGQSPSQGGGW